ncbi:hypothetical protein BC827DRAFT_1385153 [Russula dissimulans]|nr:hypothetical protein BC827DRAFT_1385153 [Russula dissimulans]
MLLHLQGTALGPPLAPRPRVYICPPLSTLARLRTRPMLAWHHKRAGLCRAIARDNVAEFKVISGAKAERDVAMGSYLYISGIDMSLSTSLAAYINSLTHSVEEPQAWFTKGLTWKVERAQASRALLEMQAQLGELVDNVILRSSCCHSGSNGKHAYSWNTYLLKCPRSGQADPCAFATTPSTILNDVIAVVILLGGDSVKVSYYKHHELRREREEGTVEGEAPSKRRRITPPLISEPSVVPAKPVPVPEAPLTPENAEAQKVAETAVSSDKQVAPQPQPVQR